MYALEGNATITILTGDTVIFQHFFLSVLLCKVLVNLPEWDCFRSTCNVFMLVDMSWWQLLSCFMECIV